MKKLVLLLTLVLALCAATVANATPVLDFNVAPPQTGAVISFDGSILNASGLTIGSIVGLNTPLNNNVLYPIVPPVMLSFQATNYLGSWNFGQGGSILVTMGQTTLMQGTITQLQVIPVTGSFKVEVGAFVDYKDCDLAGFYGLPGGDWMWTGNMNISFLANATPGDPFTSTSVLSGDVTNSPVPEPASLLLIGGGLLGLSGFRRFKK